MSERYLCEYQFDGGEWGVEIPAASFEEASRRMRAIGMTGQVKGPIAFKIDFGTRPVNWAAELYRKWLARIPGAPGH